MILNWLEPLLAFFREREIWTLTHPLLKIFCPEVVIEMLHQISRTQMSNMLISYQETLRAIPDILVGNKNYQSPA